MASDAMRMAKALGRAIVGIGAGALLAYEYYSYSPNQDEAVGIAVGMGIVAALVIFFLLSSLGKSSD